MLILVSFFLCLLLALHAYRQYWAKRDLPRVYTDNFDGELMKLGETFIARRSARNGSQRTIVCFPGFLEDMRYFQDVYKDDEAELILVNNANYHCPLVAGDVTKLAWAANPFVMGTIEHDAFYLGLVLERLATGHNIHLHGHSRGGAVVLETGRQYPELTGSKERYVSAILEAAVLPQARTAGKGSDPLPHLLVGYFMPIYLGLLRNISEDRLLKNLMMRPTNALKTQLCLSCFSLPCRYDTCVTNVKSIVAWQRARHFDVYNNFASMTVVLGARDSVLDNRTMLASAEKGQARNKGVTILKTENTNHFISLEQPETIQGISK